MDHRTTNLKNSPQQEQNNDFTHFPDSLIMKRNGEIDSEIMRKRFPSHNHRKGQKIYFQGTLPFGAYFILSGRVKIIQETPNGKEKIIRIAGKGEILGFASILRGGHLGTSAQVLEEVATCFIPREEMLKLLANDSQFSMRMMQTLCQDLKDVEESLTQIAFRPVRGRVADSLLELMKWNEQRKETEALQRKLLSKPLIEEKESRNRFRIISLSRSDLAQLVGTAKETIARFITEFKKEKLIRTQGRNILIIDIPGLKKISRLYD